MAIHQTFKQTSRLRMHVASCGAGDGAVLLFLHGNLSSGVFWHETMRALQHDFVCLAPDLRGYGATQPKVIDATQGLDDLAADVISLCDALEMNTVHVIGHSMGGGVAMKMLLQRPEMIASLVLVNPLSPYGYGGSVDASGTPFRTDGTFSGAGYVDPAMVASLAAGMRGDVPPDTSDPYTAHNLITQLFVKPPYIPNNLQDLIAALYQTRIGDDWYPGDVQECPDGTGFIPGERGVVNAMSRRYFDASTMIECPHKPPLLWLRGEDDIIVADNIGFAFSDGVSGAALPLYTQPMLAQTRHVLADYASAGGEVTEQVIADTGHTPYIERADHFLRLLTGFLKTVATQSQGAG